LASAAPVAAEGTAKIKALVVVGGHDFEEAPFKAMIDALPNAECTLVKLKDDSEIFEDISKWPYDVIVLYNLTQKISERRRANFLELLHRGVGLVALHHSVADYADWPEYAAIIGCQYFLEPRMVNGVEHPKSGYQHGSEMKLHVEDASHPVTQGVRDFTVHDETYNACIFDPKARVLLTSDHPKSDRIVGLAKTYGAAKVCYLQPGHGPDIYSDANYRKLVSQAIGWAARKTG
jgi:hypothetical protein